MHPTKTGNLLVAEKAFDLITHGGVLADQRPNATFEYHDRPIARSGARYSDEADLPLQATVLFNTTENRQYEAVVHMSETLFQRAKGKQLTGPDDPGLETTGHQFADRYRAFWRYVDAQRRYLLGEPGSAGALAEATRGVDAFYEKWYPPGVY